MAGQHRKPGGDDYEPENAREIAVRKAFIAGMALGWALVLFAWMVVNLATA